MDLTGGAMQPLEVTADSREYVLVPWVMTADGVDVDPVARGIAAEMAFVRPGTLPTSGAWVSAQWEYALGLWHARVLVGPEGTVTLPRGTYDVWVRANGGMQERPVRRSSGRVRVI
ncbi:hypothetical protein [Frankia sp. CcI49]|uniref:hypothetical protein n=1 Tax=Frankia sp. CcI49 TaxID=1745382 RepID=UPI0010555D5E|nr:hypothetical protein [Frankia sp. CcI49]